MTKDDIIQTAFKVWGRELYRTTSLSDVARELGVSKPALYRHFRDKEALLDAMYTAFFDECAGFVRKGYERAVSAGSWMESNLIMMRTIAEYYMRFQPAFVFSFFMAYGVRDRKNLADEFLRRGIDLRSLASARNPVEPQAAAGKKPMSAEPPPAAEEKACARQNTPNPAAHSSAAAAGRKAPTRQSAPEPQSVPEPYPSKFQLAMATLIFSVSGFHAQSEKPDEVPSDELISDALDYIESRIVKGLGMDARNIDALDYDELEKRAEETVLPDADGDTLLKAVAGAVAEAGPWNASMEMVARRSGLSKSGLYSHFKNRRDMLDRFFITEFSRIADFAKAQIETTSVPEEQLYLAIISVVNYLRSRPEILVSIDWIKNRSLNLGKEVSGRLFEIMGDFKLDVIKKQDRRLLVLIAQWMLFLIVNIFAWRPGAEDKNPAQGGAGAIKFWARNTAEIPNKSFRVLFRFIALGLEGLTNA